MADICFQQKRPYGNYRRFHQQPCKAGGHPADDKQLIDILSSDAVRNTTIPDDLAGNINKALYTLDAARNNDTLKDHYYALFANGGEPIFAGWPMRWDGMPTPLTASWEKRPLMAKV